MCSLRLRASEEQISEFFYPRGKTAEPFVSQWLQIIEGRFMAPWLVLTQAERVVGAKGEPRSQQ